MSNYENIFNGNKNAFKSSNNILFLYIHEYRISEYLYISHNYFLSLSSESSNRCVHNSITS